MSAFGTGLMQGLAGAMQAQRMQQEKQRQIDLQERQLKLQKEQMKLQAELQRESASRAIQALNLQFSQEARAAEKHKIDMQNAAMWQQAMSGAFEQPGAQQPPQNIPEFLPQFYREFLQRQQAGGQAQPQGDMVRSGMTVSAQGPALQFKQREVNDYQPVRITPTGEHQIAYDKQGKPIHGTERFVPYEPDIATRMVVGPNGQNVEELYDKRTGAPLGGQGSWEVPATVTPADAARIQNTRLGLSAVTDIENMFSGKTNGEMNTLVAKANAPFGGFGDGRSLNAAFRTASDAIARGRTGAEMKDSEVENLREEFFPSTLDDLELKKKKIQRLKYFLMGAWDLIQLPSWFKEKYKPIDSYDEFIKRMPEYAPQQSGTGSGGGIKFLGWE